MNIEADFSDQTALFNPSLFGEPVHLVGLGGIGSAVARPLAMLGIRSTLHLWDPDKIEPHNLPCQHYGRSKLGKYKAEVMAELLLDYCEPELDIVVHLEKATADTAFDGIVISGVDTMEARIDLWEGLRYNPNVLLYMDGRIGGEEIQLLTVDPNPEDPVNSEDIERYEGWLFTDEVASEAPCAARTVCGPPMVLAGRITTQLTRYARGLPLRWNIMEHVGDSTISAH